MSILKLRKPFKVNGEEVTEIQYDLEELSGDDLESALNALKMEKKVVTAVEVDPSYHAAVFAYAAGLTLQDMRRMGARDYQAAIIEVRRFFLSSKEQEEQPSQKE